MQDRQVKRGLRILRCAGVKGFGWRILGLFRIVLRDFVILLADSSLMFEELVENKMMEHKRSLSTLDQSSLVNLIPKRLKTEVALSSKDKKETVSERVSALQQLVSPYGKTDTASVLFEAMEYIKFLHEQVKVLSAPYLLYSTPTTQRLGMESCNNLKERGLCVVPISLIDGVASSNGADIWAPIKTSLNSRRSVLDESSVIT